MRHRKAGKKLGRDRQGRRALFKSLIVSLIQTGRIRTTESKAKAIRPIVDKLVSKAQSASFSTHRQIQAFLQDSATTKRLVSSIAPAFSRKFGFTKMTRIGQRRGDAATIVRLEWTEEPKSPTSPKPPRLAEVPSLSKDEGGPKSPKVPKVSKSKPTTKKT